MQTIKRLKFVPYLRYMDIYKWISEAIPIGITSLLALVLTGCPNPSCPEATYAFVVSAYVFPVVDSIRLGDTLYTQSSFSSQLRDISSGQNINYANASPIGGNLFLDALASNGTYLRGAIGDFTNVSKRGQIYDDQENSSQQRIKHFSYQSSASGYNFEAGLIPLKRGLFLISTNTAISNGISGEKSCSKAMFDVNLVSSSINLHYIEIATGRPVERRDSLHAYCVKVF